VEDIGFKQRTYAGKISQEECQAGPLEVVTQILLTKLFSHTIIQSIQTAFHHALLELIIQEIALQIYREYAQIALQIIFVLEDIILQVVQQRASLELMKLLPVQLQLIESVLLVPLVVFVLEAITLQTVQSHVQQEHMKPTPLVHPLQIKSVLFAFLRVFVLEALTLQTVLFHV